MLRLLPILLLLIPSAFVQAQKRGQALVDSELSVLPRAPSDTVRARVYNNVSTFYMDVNTDSAIKYADLGMQLVCSMNWTRGIAVFNTCYANIFSTKGELDSCMNRHRAALALFETIHDSVNIAITNNGLGTVAKAKSDFVAATRYFMHTLQMGKYLRNNYLIGLGSENLALVYEYQEDYSKGLEYARQAVAAYTLDDDQDALPAPIGLIGDIFSRLKKYDSAFIYYTRSLYLTRKTGNKTKEGTILNYMAEYYSSQGDYPRAIQYALEGQKLWDSTGESSEDAINNKGILGFYYLQLAKQEPVGQGGRVGQAGQVGHRDKWLRLAIGYLSEAVRKSGTRSIKTSQSEFQASLAEAYALAGNYKDAFLNYKSYQEIKDSIFSQENKNKIAAAMSKLELDKKNAEINLNQLTIVNQHRQELYMTIGLILLLIIGGLLYRQSLVRKRSNTTLLVLNNELDEANKVKAKFFGILSHDLRSPISNLVNFLALQRRRPGSMSEEQINDREKKIADSANSLLETMEAMLLWSKGQMEHFKPSMVRVRVDGLFAYLRKNFADTDQLALHFAPAGDLEVLADEQYLRTIMYNLTANAVKALRQETDGQIQWKALRRGNDLLLSISDNGPGASNEQLRALYDESAPSGARTGLGLHIIRDLAKAIGCVVTYHAGRSEGDAGSGKEDAGSARGAEFTLCLPVG
ncbi:MAG: tetratricopeptide repeat-containing sensor histidine kinase [Bacteroidota bacterium]|nr:tetratricopeptide repeat-containing sensor histidine kinase [Bacteroidota bacterium]